MKLWLILLIALSATQIATAADDAIELGALLARGRETLAGRSIQIESTIDARLPGPLTLRRTTTAILLTGPNGDFRIETNNPDRPTGRERIFFDRNTLARVNDDEKTFSRIAATAFSAAGELFLEATAISDFPSFVWWSERVSGKEFVAGFDTCRLQGRERIDGQDCAVYRLTGRRAVAQLAVPADGLPRRWLIDGAAFLPDALNADGGGVVRRTETWAVQDGANSEPVAEEIGRAHV